MIEMDGKDIKKDFPIFSKRPELTYFDNACTTLKPKQVIDAVVSYYSDYSACSGRSGHKMAKEVDLKFEESRAKVAKFVGANADELVWTKNTTEGINIVANSFDFSKRKKVVMTNLEHHSAILPFQKLSESGRVTLEFVSAGSDGTISDEQWKKAIDSETALVVVHHSNNSIGTRSNLKEIVKLAHEKGALALVDGAQGVPHCEVNFKRENYDFLAFSAHKMLGPTGIGGLVVKKDLLQKMPPFIVGGGTIQDVKLDYTEYLKTNHKFEPGIQHYSGAIGFGAAVDYLSKLGMKNVEAYEHKLADKMNETLNSVPGVEIYGPEFSDKHGALFSFNIKGAKPHEVALLLDKPGIAVRSGVFCAQPAMEAMGQKDGAVRASLYIYNTEQEIEFFGEKLGKIAQLYR
ncbi:MAG: cysteine desulfurase [Candidatus Micrarchaeia archaeon]